MPALRNAAPRPGNVASCAASVYSNSIERAAGPGIEAAELRFDRSGAATILAGSISNGQGP